MPASPELSKKQLRKLSKRERDAYAKEMMQVRWKQAKRRKIMNRILIVLGSLTGVAIAGGVVGLSLLNQYNEANRGPENMASDGILFTGDGTYTNVTTTDAIAAGDDPVATVTDDSTDVVPIVIYADLADSDTVDFLTANLETVEGWLSAGYITLEIHPIAATDDDAGFSENAANALACVAEYSPDNFLGVLAALVTASTEAAAQDVPESLTNDDIVLEIREVGISDEDAEDCVTDDRFASWVSAATSRAHARIPNADVGELTGGSLVTVYGTSYTGEAGDADAFTTFISEVASG